jgi:hypothetical protein
MIRRYIYRFNDWFNSRGEWMQICLYFGFCIAFLAMLAVSIYFSRFDEQVTRSQYPRISASHQARSSLIH